MRAGYGRACELPRPRDPAGAGLFEEAAPAALAYLDFPVRTGPGSGPTTFGSACVFSQVVLSRMCIRN